MTFPTKRVRHLFECCDGRRIPLNAEQRSERQGDVPYWGANSIVDFVDVALFDEELVLLGEDGAPFFDRDKPKAFRVTGATWPNNHIHVLRPLSGVVAKYMVYALNSVDFAPYINGSTRDKLTQAAMNDIALPFPQIEIQERIANFLDEQTGRIDALIAEKEALLLKLSESRYSYVSQLMSKGLTSTPSLSKTSFPELGSVPSHWTVKRLKFLGEVRSGIAKGKDHGEKDTVSLPYLRVANVQDGYVDLTEVLEIEVGAQEVERFLLKKGDVLMNEGGDNDKLGRGTVWEGQIYPCVHQNHVFAVRMFDTGLAEWVARFTSTDAARTYFFLRSKQSTNLASINQTNVRELPVPMPPAEEREAILAEIRRSAKATSELVEHVKEHIDHLKEYRASLISHAVTGQLDLAAFKEAA